MRLHVRLLNSLHKKTFNGVQYASTFAKNTNTRKKLLWIIPISTFLLGTWQTQRLIWKKKIIARVTEELNQPAIELEPPQLESLKKSSSKKVCLKGKFDPSEVIFLGPRSNGTESSVISNASNNGFYAIMPFTLDGTKRILVNRGWIPMKMRKEYAKNAKNYTPKGEVFIDVFSRKGEKNPEGNKVPQIPSNRTWFWLDLDTMSSVARTNQVIVDLVNTPRNEEIQLPEDPIPRSLTPNIRNKHLEYVLTWYGISITSALLLLSTQKGTFLSKMKRL